MSGRISALAGYNRCVPARSPLFVGARRAAGCGSRPTGGTTFKPVFDEQPVQSIGAIRARSLQSEERLGGQRRELGRATACRSADGVYKSTDAGEEPGRTSACPTPSAFPRSSSNPRSADTVYACVPRQAVERLAPRRGLYKTTDGGGTWQLILKGANLSNRLRQVIAASTHALRTSCFASLWDFRRKGWIYRSGGEGPTAFSGSGLYRSAGWRQELDRTHSAGQ